MGNGDYVIVKCSDCFRVTYVNDDSLHTHVKSRRIAEKLIYVACKSKIPLDEDYIFYESLYRILPACELKHKAYEVMIAKSKRKQEYYNPFRKRAGGNFKESMLLSYFYMKGENTRDFSHVMFNGLNGGNLSK